MGCLGPRARPGSVRTKILFDDGGILEIYHLERQATLTGVGLLRGEIVKQGASCITVYVGPFLYKHLTVSRLLLLARL
jgi:hypothetical protein